TLGVTGSSPVAPTPRHPLSADDSGCFLLSGQALTAIVSTPSLCPCSPAILSGGANSPTVAGCRLSKSIEPSLDVLMPMPRTRPRRQLSVRGVVVLLGHGD